MDPTGAGDSFAGGLMGHLASSDRTDREAIQEGLAWGTISASCTLRSFGLDGLCSTDRAELDAMMERFQSAARVGPRAVNAG